MSDSKGEFEHDALHDTQMLARYFRELADGIEAGNVRLQDDHGDLQLAPKGLIRLRLRAMKKSDRVRLGVTISWNRRPRSFDDAESLRISSGNRDEETDFD